jgi:transposase-like protein
MSGKRRKFTAAEKVRVLRRHLVDKVPVSEVCEKEGIQPTQFYNWQKQLFEGAAALFDGPAPKKDRKAEAKVEAKVEALTAKLRRKDEVLSELMEEHVALKKSLGEI